MTKDWDYPRPPGMPQRELPPHDERQSPPFARILLAIAGLVLAAVFALPFVVG